jgi:hypothetical protein
MLDEQTEREHESMGGPLVEAPGEMVHLAVERLNFYRTMSSSVSASRCYRGPRCLFYITACTQAPRTTSTCSTVDRAQHTSCYLFRPCLAETWFSGRRRNAPQALARTASAMCPSCSTPSLWPRTTSLPHVPAAAVAFVASARLRRYPGYISDPRRAPHVVMLRHVLLLELGGSAGQEPQGPGRGH